MADEAPATDVNSQNTVSAASTEVVQSTQATPPAGEKPVAQSETENRVPQARFNEVIEQRNHEREQRQMYENRIRELENRVNNVQQQESVVDAQTKRLVEKLKLTPEAAREIVSSQHEVARAERGQVEAQMRSFQMQNWQRQMEDKHKDYRELMPQMEKVYSSLNQQGQQYVTTSFEGLQYIYDRAKASVADVKAQESYNNGASAAYQTKSLKQAVTPGPGGSAATQTGKLTLQAIRDMDVKEYQKRLPEINKAINDGTLGD